MKYTWIISRRDFLKTGIVLSAGLPLVHSCNLIGNQNESDDLFALFKNPPSTAKPFVRWWWNGLKLTADEILRELDVMRDAGIGGVEINSIAFPPCDDLGIPSLTWLSPEWIEMVKVALKGAEQRDMTCDIIVGSGWPFGAEYLTGDERSQLLTLTNQIVKGPGKVTLKVADIVKEATPSVFTPYEGVVNEIYALCLTPLQMETFTPPINLPFEKAEEMTVTIPDGEYILYALVKMTGYNAVIYGAPGAAGPIMNHYNKAAVEKYLNHMSDNLFPKLEGMKSFRALFCDSMELEGANWCPDFIDEFKRRNGYDLSPYLPFILKKVGELGRHLDDTVTTQTSGAARDEIERVRYDYFDTCMDMILNRFLKPFTQWCNRYGFQSKVQPYGREYHPLDASLYVDIPECETWVWYNDSNPQANFVKNPAYTTVNKFVSSAAHFADKKTVSCEEVTNIKSVFNVTLERVKITGDQSNTSGVTRSVLHGYSYSPLEAPFPGWVRYGTFFNERNTWWPYFKLWAAYKTRISAILGETDFFADIAVMHPLADLWSKHSPQIQFPDVHYPLYQYRVWEAIHRNGNSCDYISEHIIQQSIPVDGYLKYNRRAYHTLILLEVESMYPATAEMIAAFVDNGGKVIFVGKEPYKSPGLRDHQTNDEKVRQTIADMKAKHAARVFTVATPAIDEIANETNTMMEMGIRIDMPVTDNIEGWFRNVQHQCGIKPYMIIDRPNPYITQIRHTAKGKDLFFITNCSMVDNYVIQAGFPHSKGQPWLWDAETGERSRFPGAVGRNRTLTIDLPAAGSKLIVFDEHTNGKDIPALPEIPSTGMALTGWNVRMQHINGATEERTFPTLFDLASDESTRAFAGYLFYQKKLDIDTSSFTMLDLGRVFGVSEVTLNGENLGCQWYGRHLYRIPEHLAKAPNKTIEVKITTTIGNYLKSSPDNIPGYNWTKDQGWQPIGLIGPVTLL